MPAFFPLILFYRYKKPVVLGGVIYLHDISGPRHTGIAFQHLQKFNELYRDAALNTVVLCTNNREMVALRDREMREAEMQTLHWKEILKKGSEVRRFMGDQNSAREIVSVVLQRASLRRRGEIALQIRNGIAGKRKLAPETKAGKELCFMLKESLELQRMAVALEMARGDGTDVDGKLAETLQNMDKITNQIQSLKVPLGRRIKRFLGLTVSHSLDAARPM